MSNHADVIPDELVLAAIDRAGRHHARDGEVIKGSIYAHLAIPSRSGPARHVHKRLAALETAGIVECSHRLGSVVWSLTDAGRRRLQRARRSGTLPVLPESPQHRAWREARTLAEQQIEGFRKDLHDQAESALWLLDSPRLLGQETPVESDAWFTLGEFLQRACGRLASATHCLSEWAEPDDAHADIDDGLEPAERNLDARTQARLRSKRAGRRNPRNWGSQITGGGSN